MKTCGFDESEAWRAMIAIATTLKRFLNETIIAEFGYGKRNRLKENILLLNDEISNIMEHIEKIRNMG